MNACTYHQNCPVCGRSLSINVTLLGQRVYCQHCGGGFVACDPSNGGVAIRGQADRIDDLIERASEILSRASFRELESADSAS